MMTRGIQANKCLDITPANADDVPKFICAFVVIDNQHLGGEEVPFLHRQTNRRGYYTSLCPNPTHIVLSGL